MIAFPKTILPIDMKKILALTLITAGTAFAQDIKPDDLKASADRGKGFYMTTCVACHQPTGAGLPGVFPPFDGSEYVVGDARRLVAIVIKGLNGPITVKGTKYPGAIPATKPMRKRRPIQLPETTAIMWTVSGIVSAFMAVSHR